MLPCSTNIIFSFYNIMKNQWTLWLQLQLKLKELATLWFACRHSMAWQKVRRFGYFPLCMYGLLYDWRAIITRMANIWLRFIVLLTNPVHKCAFWHGIVWLWSLYQLSQVGKILFAKNISKHTENFQLTSYCDVDSPAWWNLIGWYDVV